MKFYILAQTNNNKTQPTKSMLFLGNSPPRNSMVTQHQFLMRFNIMPELELPPFPDSSLVNKSTNHTASASQSQGAIMLS